MKTIDNIHDKKYSVPVTPFLLALAVVSGFMFLSPDFTGIMGAGPKPAYGADTLLGEVKGIFEVTPISQVDIDAEGLPLRFPYFLFFDDNAEETYLTTGGRSQIVVYRKDFFPLESLNLGRGISKPHGLFVDNKGLVYICQTPADGKPGRITILNGAFFIVREITFEAGKIPDAPDFVPRNLVVNRDGLMYVSSMRDRGIVVLDNEGIFLRWLQPQDVVISRKLPGEENEMAPEDEIPTSEPSDEPAKQKNWSEIPEEFRPRTSQEKEASEPTIGPVLIRSVHIDSEGNLYLIGGLNGKIYVYSPDETFLFSFGRKGGTPGTLSQPRGVAIDREHNLIYVVDYMRHTILAYDLNGTFLFEFGGKGSAPGWFKFPTNITVNRAGQVIVTDLFNHQIQVLKVKYQATSTLANQPQDTLPPAASDLNKETTPGKDLSEPPVETAGQELIKEEPLPGQPDAGSEQKDKLEADADQPDATALAKQTPEQEMEKQAAIMEPVQKSSGPENETSMPLSSQPEQPAPAAKPEAAAATAAESSAKVEQPPVSAADTPNFDAVEPFVASWVGAWEQKDIEAYLLHYSPNFITPKGTSLAAWEIQRHQSLGRPQWIKIEIRDMQTQKVDDTHAQVTFIQEYQSNTYSDKVAKDLDLIWENGKWMIFKETSKAL
jgi:DNA-binding beta-propeller fold protein YncE